MKGSIVQARTQGRFKRVRFWPPITLPRTIHYFPTICNAPITVTVVSRKYAPPFATLASVQNAGGGAYTRNATISLAITPSLSIKHDSIVICRWGVEAKR